MISTELLEHIVKLAIYSSKVKDERPLSIILVAKPEYGKTEILKKFIDIQEVFYTADFNSYIFNDFVIKHQAKDKSIIIIPDFLKVVKKKHTTVSVSLGLLNAITEEGFVGKSFGCFVEKPITANVITSLTETEITDKRHKWAKLGLISRFLLISYSYTDETISTIRSFIQDRHYADDKNYEFELPKEKIHITLPKIYSEIIKQLSIKIALKNNLVGFRLQKQLQTLSMASALINNRDMVVSSDMEILNEISKFINFDFTKI